jgi:hypothetical protein
MSSYPAFVNVRLAAADVSGVESRALLAMAGQLQGFVWLPYWRELEFSRCNWQHRVGCVLDLLSSCLRGGGRRRGAGAGASQCGVGREALYSLAAAGGGGGRVEFSSRCVLLDRGLLGRRSEVVELKGSRAHRGHYACIKLGHVVVPGGGASVVAPVCAVYKGTRSGKHATRRRGGAGAAASGAAAGVVRDRRVPVVITVQQVLALALHGFPPPRPAGAGGGRWFALHVPHECQSQHGLCANMHHIAWGDAAGNALHRKLTCARARTFHTPLAWQLDQQVQVQLGREPRRISAADVQAVARVLSMSMVSSPPPPAAAAGATGGAVSMCRRYRVLPTVVPSAAGAGSATGGAAKCSQRLMHKSHAIALAARQPMSPLRVKAKRSPRIHLRCK